MEWDPSPMTLSTASESLTAIGSVSGSGSGSESLTAIGSVYGSGSGCGYGV